MSICKDSQWKITAGERIKLESAYVEIEMGIDWNDSEWRRADIARGWRDAGPSISGEFTSYDYESGGNHTFDMSIAAATALRDWLNSALAQMEERGALNAEVSGSSPERAAK